MAAPSTALTGSPARAPLRRARALAPTKAPVAAAAAPPTIAAAANGRRCTSSASLKAADLPSLDSAMRASSSADAKILKRMRFARVAAIGRREAQAGRAARGSEPFQHIFGAADVECARFLYVELGDGSVVDQHRETLAAPAHAELGEIRVGADRPDEIAAAVGEHGHLALGVGAVGPGVEHEGVVDRGAGDLVDALRLELVDLLDEAGKVPGRAGRREGPRHREQSNLAAAEIILAVDRLRALGSRLDEIGLGEAVADLNRHG